MKKSIWALLAAGALFGWIAEAQAPPLANLGQLMKGTLYPESNVVFAAQDQNPADVPRAKDPNMATDLLTSSYGKWMRSRTARLPLPK